MEILKLGIILCVFCIISAGVLAKLNNITSPIVKKYKIKKEETARREVLNFSKIDLLNISDGEYKYFNELNHSKIKFYVENNTLKGSISYEFTDDSQKGVAEKTQNKIVSQWGNIIDMKLAKGNEKPFVKIMLKALSKNFKFKKSNKKFKDNIEFYECYNKDKLLGVVAKIAPTGYSSKLESLIGINKNGVITGVTVLSQTETPGLGARMTEIDPLLATSLKEKFSNDLINVNKPWFTGQFTGVDLKHCVLTKDDSVNGKIDAITAATISSRALTNGINKALKLFNETYKSN